MTFSRKTMERSLRRTKRKLRRFLRKAKKRRFYPIYAALLLILVWSLVLPQSFSDFVWTYFRGPMVADVWGAPVDGIKEGYNPVNTITYGLILVAAVYYGWKPLKKRKIWFDSGLLLSLLPLILVGALSRVLEDASAYPIPAAYFFISPLIYLWIGFLGLFFVLFAGFLERREREESLVLGTVIYPFTLKFLWYFMGDRMSGYDIIFFILLTVLFIAFHIVMMKKDGYEMLSSVFLYSSYVLSVFVYYAFASFDGVPHISVLPAVLGMAALVTFSVGCLSKYGLAPSYFSKRLNLAIVFSHSLDGAATWIGIDYYGYGEKHVLAGALTGAFGGFSFFIAKVVLSVLLVYLLDAAFKKEIRDENLSGLIKFVIIFLGLGPGLRDLLRIALGA